MPLKAISTLSLGSCQYHSMRSKLEAATLAGFTAIDLFDSDWERFKNDYALEHSLPQSTIDGDPTSIAAAKALNSLCTAYNIVLLCLQPFREFEARLDPKEATQRMHAARGAVSILPFLGCNMLLIPSTTLSPSRLVLDTKRVATELGELADHASKLSVNGAPLKICYEALSWGTFVNTWEHAWEIIKFANRPNLGLCLDSFNTAAREWADPYHSSGIQQPLRFIESSFKLSLAKMSELPSNKIFYFQVADGKRMIPALTPSTDPTVPPLRPWSRSSRLFPLEVSRGAYLPVLDFARAVVRSGYDGPWALEVFNDSLDDPRLQVPSEHAIRGLESLEKLFMACQSEFKIRITPIPTPNESSRSIDCYPNQDVKTVSMFKQDIEDHAVVDFSVPANSLNHTRFAELALRILPPRSRSISRQFLPRNRSNIFVSRSTFFILFLSILFGLLMLAIGTKPFGLFG